MKIEGFADCVPPQLLGERYCGQNNAQMLPCVHGENSYSTSNFFNQLSRLSRN